MPTDGEIISQMAPLEEKIAAIIADFELPGLALGIVRGEEMVYARGFGVKNAFTREPVAPDSLFHMASISKPFVCTGVMQLVEQGKIDLAAPLVTYLPYFKLDDERYRRITIKQMLSHTSGMPDVEDYHWNQPEYDDGAAERYVRSLAQEKMIFDPGEKFAYSNMAYEVLGHVIARVSGQAFEDYMEEHILKPLGMENSTFLKVKASPALRTTPHVNAPLLEISPYYPYHRAHAPSSTLHSNVLEMGRWMIANLKRGRYGDFRMLQEASYDLLWQPYMQAKDFGPGVSIGLSWFINKHRGHLAVRHAGGDIGFQTHHVLLPEQSLGVVVLANTVPAPVRVLAEAVLDQLLGYEPQMPKTPAILPFYKVYQEKREEAAIGFYREMQQEHPDDYDFNPQRFSSAGELRAEIGRIGQAIEIIRLGLSLYPENDELYRTLAWAYKKNGDQVLALEYIQKCLVLNPENAEGNKLLEELGGTIERAA